MDRVLIYFDLINQPSIPRKVWLECQLAVFETRLELCIIDYSPPFDLDACIQSYCQGNQNNTGGGRGVIILHKIADRLSYLRTEDDRNCLRIVKNYYPVVDDRRLL